MLQRTSIMQIKLQLQVLLVLLYLFQLNAILFYLKKERKMYFFHSINYQSVQIIVMRISHQPSV